MSDAKVLPEGTKTKPLKRFIHIFRGTYPLDLNSIDRKKVYIPNVGKKAILSGMPIPTHSGHPPLESDQRPNAIQT
jgi:hypothetical protein